MSNKLSAQAGPVAAVPKDTTPPPKDHFSALPAELRLMIYDYVAIDHSPHETIVNRNKSDYEDWTEEDLLTADSPYHCKTLLSISHLIRKDVAPIYYGKNTFGAVIQVDYEEPIVHSPQMKNLRGWLHDSGKENAALIKTFHPYLQPFGNVPFGPDFEIEGWYWGAPKFRLGDLETKARVMHVLGLANWGLRPEAVTIKYGSPGDWTELELETGTIEPCVGVRKYSPMLLPEWDGEKPSQTHCRTIMRGDGSRWDKTLNRKRKVPEDWSE